VHGSGVGFPDSIRSVAALVLCAHANLLANVAGMGIVDATGGISGVVIHLKVVPGARQNKVCGALGDRLKVQVSAPPEDGKANRAVCELLAKVLGVREDRVEVVAGPSSPRKTVRVAGIDVATARAKLGV